MESPNPRSPEPPTDLLADLTRQVESLAARVSALEQRAAPLRTAASSTPPAPPKFRFGLATVNRVGALTLALGILFFFEYAAENHWIGPSGRLVAGVLVGLAFLAYGEWLRRRQSRILAQGIAACGLATLYITSYASSEWYKLLIPAAALAGMAIVAAAGLWGGLLYESGGLCGMAALGWSLALLLTYRAFDSTIQIPWLVAGDLGLIFLVVRAARWSWLIPVGTAIPLVIESAMDPHRRPVALLCAILAALSWTAMQFAPTVAVRRALYVTGHGALAVAMLLMAAILVDQPTVALTVASILLAAYGTALLAIGVSRGSDVDRWTGLGLITLVVLKLYLYDVWHLSYGARIAAFVLLGAILLSASFIYSRWRARP